MLIGSVLAVEMAVTFPLLRYAESVGLALELVVVAQARARSGFGHRHDETHSLR